MVGTAGAAVGHHMATKSQQEAQQNAQIQELQAQQQQAAAPAPAPAPAAPAGGGDDLASKLTQLKSLMDQGVLTPQEFEQAKQKLLSS
jgi:multidrug resistance efflux pump